MLKTFNVKNYILDCLFPIYCPKCDIFIQTDTGFFACKNCLKELELNSSLYCPACLKKLPNDSKTVFQKCSCNKKLSLDFFGFAVDYQDILIKKLIHNFKYRFAKKINFTLAYVLSIYLEKSIPIKEMIKDWLIIPIPLHKSRKNWRGFNQSEEIAKIIGEKYNLKIATDNLIRIKKTPPQAEIEDWQTRKKNISLAFAIKNPTEIKDKNIILIDDVRSSGATLEESARLLKSAGVKKIIGLTVAR